MERPRKGQPTHSSLPTLQAKYPPRRLLSARASRAPHTASQNTPESCPQEPFAPTSLKRAHSREGTLWTTFLRAGETLQPSLTDTEHGKNHAFPLDHQAAIATSERSHCLPGAHSEFRFKVEWFVMRPTRRGQAVDLPRLVLPVVDSLFTLAPSNTRLALGQYHRSEIPNLDLP